MLGRFPRMEIIQREETDKFLIWNDLGKPPPTEHVTHAHAFSLSRIYSIPTHEWFDTWSKNGGQKTLQLVQVETVLTCQKN